MSIHELIDFATKEYGTSEGEFWLAAFPTDVQAIKTCGLADSCCATIADGKAMLPVSNEKIRSATVYLDRPFRLLLFSLPNQASDGMKQFLSFTAQAVHLLRTDPPSWGRGIADGQVESPFLTWAAFLFFVAPDAHSYVKPSRDAALHGKLVTIRTPWTASLAVLREWESDVFIGRLLTGRDVVKLSPSEMNLLEAYLRSVGHSRTEADRNKLMLIRDFNRGLLKTDAPSTAAVQAEATAAAAQGDNASLALMRVFTNGISDDRIEKAALLLYDGALSANEKLTKIDALLPIPPTASAEQLGIMIGVTKQAVLKTPWWTQNRKGEKKSEVGRRRESHRKRAKSYEAPDQDGDD